jgi:hypothetical protein
MPSGSDGVGCTTRCEPPSAYSWARQKDLPEAVANLRGGRLCDKSHGRPVHPPTLGFRPGEMIWVLGCRGLGIRKCVD